MNKQAKERWIRENFNIGDDEAVPDYAIKHVATTQLKLTKSQLSKIQNVCEKLSG